MFLVLPLLTFLGYDVQNPDEVCPEHGADFSEKYKNRVDYVILKAALPVIAIKCKTVGLPIKDERGQLRSYFNAAPTVKMGVISDGLIYAFYADTDEPNMMDQNEFLSVDLREVAKGKIEDSVEVGLKSLQKNTFDPENIGTEAKPIFYSNAVLPGTVAPQAFKAIAWQATQIAQTGGGGQNFESRIGLPVKTGEACYAPACREHLRSFVAKAEYQRAIWLEFTHDVKRTGEGSVYPHGDAACRRWRGARLFLGNARTAGKRASRSNERINPPSMTHRPSSGMNVP